MLKPGLERFDSPVVMINQHYRGEDWGVVASYTNEQDATSDDGTADSTRVGWHVSVTLPDLEDVEFDQVFSTPEAALEFGITQILSGSLDSTMGHSNGIFPFGQYENIA